MSLSAFRRALEYFWLVSNINWLLRGETHKQRSAAMFLLNPACWGLTGVFVHHRHIRYSLQPRGKRCLDILRLSERIFFWKNRHQQLCREANMSVQMNTGSCRQLHSVLLLPIPDWTNWINRATAVNTVRKNLRLVRVQVLLSLKIMRSFLHTDPSRHNTWFGLFSVIDCQLILTLLHF